MYKPADPKPNFPKIDEKILSFWKKSKTFEQSIAKRPKDNKWIFLDGPPFITGLPHYGSLLSSIPKDVFPRFWTMKGYRVRRVWGWDCHGLPAENKVEKNLGIARKKDIEEKIGIARFIEECRAYVGEVSSEWEWYIDRVGRWVDFKNAYKTMDIDYMETVMWVFKQMHEKEYIYKGLRVSLFCPHCSTPISNFEVAMDSENYKNINDFSTVYKYKSTSNPDLFYLAWSTTPWNKLATPALAVNPKLIYVKVKAGNEFYILAKSTLKILKDEYEIIKEIKGKDIVDNTFELHYDFYEVSKGKKAGVIIGGDFVSSEEGTGIVTLAAYGEEDLHIMQENNIALVMHVDMEGVIKDTVPLFGGMYYLEANKLVNEDLHNRNLIYRQDKYVHSMPHCWRCETQLFYAPQDAWYVNIQKLKPLLQKNNKAINWYPKHFKYGRFKKSIDSAPDWCISRSRYWGSPVPVWECSCGNCFVPGSIDDLEKESGQKVTDLHRPNIDKVIMTCRKCGKKIKRVPEVLDSWMDAGSAAFAERHFPFNKKLKLEDFFPPDFIVEYTGQIRAWFYVLNVLSTALYDLPAFKNVLVTGVILGTDGKKMSKNYGNYPDPKEMLEKYGGDALRLYLLGSPVMKGEDICISEQEYRNQVKDFLLPYWNIYNFYTMYANHYSFIPINGTYTSSKVLDRWIISRCAGSIRNIQKALESYDTADAINFAGIFIVRDLSMWYVRQIRERVRFGQKKTQDIDEALYTLRYVLKEYTKVIAPIIPFITEEIYANISNKESVHLQDWPAADSEDKELEEEMEYVIKLVSSIHAFRKDNCIKVRTPIKKLSYKGPREILGEFLGLALQETNIYNLLYLGSSKSFKIEGSIDENNLDAAKGEARELIRKIQQERKKLGLKPEQKVSITLQTYPSEFKDFIQERVTATSIAIGEFSVTPVE